MKELETYIIIESFKNKLYKYIEHQELVETEGIPWIIFKIKEKIPGLGRMSKLNILKSLWGSPQEVYESFVYSDMIRNGYLIVPIENGWLCISPNGEDYQLEDQSCTCGDFVLNRKQESRCKHLIMRDWELHYRMRQNKYRREING